MPPKKRSRSVAKVAEGEDVPVSTPRSKKGKTDSEKQAAAAEKAKLAAEKKAEQGAAKPLQGVVGSQRASDWATFTSKFPNWERDLVGFDKSSIHRILKEETGISSVSLANDLFDHLVFAENGRWPTTFDPKAILSATAPTLSFITTTAGEWVFSEKSGPAKPADADRMVRPMEYKIVWDTLESLRKAAGRRGLLIKGHPGIGKTYLLDVLLSMSLHEYPTVPVVVIAVGALHVFTNIGGKTPKRYKVSLFALDPMTFPQRLQKLGVAKWAEVLVLHDIKRTQTLAYQAALLDNMFGAFSVTCVVASSPDPDNYTDFYKATNAGVYRVILLPTLSGAEARAFAKSKSPGLPDATFAEWYDAVGGVPRHLESQCSVDIAVEGQKGVAPTVQFDPSATASDKETNKIVQMVPSVDRVSLRGFDFVSQGACRVWLKSQERGGNPSKLLNMLRDAKDGDATRDTLGRFFENWFLSKLARSPRLSRLSLDSANATLVPWVIDSPLTVTRFPGDEPNKIRPTTNPTLHIPMSSKFPVVDAVLTMGTPPLNSKAKVDTLLIQVTVAGDSKPQVGPIKALLDALTSANCKAVGLVWVVDSVSTLRKRQALEAGTLPAYDQLPQWLCRVDEFMCWVRRESTKGHTTVAFPCLPSATEDSILKQVQMWVDPTAIKLTNYAGTIGTENNPLVFK